MKVWLLSSISVLLVSLISLVGVFTLSIRRELLQKMTLLMVSFAVGALFGDAFIHLLPESFGKLGTNLGTSLYIITGILIFFILEKFIRWRHCHAQTTTNHVHPVVALNLIGDGVHNLIDGMIIAGSFSISTSIGLATSLAVILHEIPQEMGDFGVLIHGGLTIKKALFFNFLSALTAFVGMFIALIIGQHVKGFTLALLPITAGGFLYIAGSDLIPELQQGCDIRISAAVWQFIAMVLGILIMTLLVLLD
jgi:zinc and cadmium transporter